MKLRFDKDGLIPMVIQDSDTGEVLSLVYGNSPSISKMNRTGWVWRYSRSKKKVMVKGGTSGNKQNVVSLSKDCDGDALLVRVKPLGPACHKGTVSCFKSNSDANAEMIGELSIISELVRVISERKQNPIPGSYTSEIVLDRNAIVAKLREECEELIEAKGRKNLAWEAADLFFFMLVYLENQNLPFSQVLKELRRRRSKRK